jgi:lauroyl/myristoyl acyltransferase
MTTPTPAPPKRPVVLHSPALHLGSIEIRETGGQGGKTLFSGTRLKGLAFPALYWLIRHLPTTLAMLPVRITVAMLRMTYRRPGNRLRKACEAITRLAERDAAGSRDPRRVYNRFLDNALGVIGNFFTLYQHGRAAVLPVITMASEDVETVERLIEEHGGAVLAVPHNVGSALSALRIGHNFDMLLVAKNSPGVPRTRIALDFYERMKVSVLMVRGANTHALSRALFAALKHQKLVAATLDNLDRSGRCVGVRMFGQEVGLSGWAASIAVRMQVPVIPAWFHSEGCKQHVTIGEAIVAQDTRAATQHYARFFEQQILRDPASWAYLADKHWQALLQRAAQPGVD